MKITAEIEYEIRRIGHNCWHYSEMKTMRECVYVDLLHKMIEFNQFH